MNLQIERLDDELVVECSPAHTLESRIVQFLGLFVVRSPCWNLGISEKQREVKKRELRDELC